MTNETKRPIGKWILGIAAFAIFSAWGLYLWEGLNSPGRTYSVVDPIVKAPTEFSLNGDGGISILGWISGLIIVFIVIYIFDIAVLSEKISGKKVINWHKTNGILSVIFLVVGMAYAIWETVVHGNEMANHSITEHGPTIKSMFMWTFIFTGIVFVITQILLFYFAYKYSYKEGKKGLYYSHNNKIELLWTVIPAIVLTFLVLRGFFTWRKITGEPPEKSTKIEVFAYQFGWNARYAGDDGKLGEYNYNFISGTNQLGLAVRPFVDSLSVELKGRVAELDKLIASISDSTKVYADLVSRTDKSVYPDQYAEYSKILNEYKSGEKKGILEEEKYRKNKQIERIGKYIAAKENSKFNGAAEDDIITDEIHIVKNQSVTLKFRARDVIHSAYIADFQVQMNCVPGMTTQFHFVPTKTTSEMRQADTAFKDFYLVCAKICGASHSKMKIKVVVEEEAEYKTWLASQQSVVPKAQPALPPTEMNAPAPADSIKKDKTVAIK